MQVPEWDASRAADFLQGLSSFTTLQKASPANRPMQVLISTLALALTLALAPTLTLTLALTPTLTPTLTLTPSRWSSSWTATTQATSSTCPSFTPRRRAPRIAHFGTGSTATGGPAEMAHPAESHCEYESRRDYKL